MKEASGRIILQYRISVTSNEINRTGELSRIGTATAASDELIKLLFLEKNQFICRIK